MGLTADPDGTTGNDCILVQGYMHRCLFEREGERLQRGLVKIRIYPRAFTVYVLVGLLLYCRDLK